MRCRICSTCWEPWRFFAAMLAYVRGCERLGRRTDTEAPE